MLWHKTRFIAGSVLLLFSTLWPGLSLTEEAERQGTETAIKRDRPYQLPSIHSNYGVLTQQQEAAIGQAWLQNIQSELNLFEDVLIADYLQHLIYDLSVAMKLTNYRFHLLLIDDKRINAFAVPGGIIGINTGLIIHADHADELASVLAHELAHLKQKHFLRNLEYLQATQNQNLTALLIGIGFFITGQADIGLATIYGNATAKQDQILAYSRDFETEADLLAQQTMQARGYRPDATIRFMEKLQQDVNNNLVLPEFLSTHPVTEKRIAALQERLLQNNFNKEQKYQPPVTDATYPYLRMRLLARYKISPQSFITTELDTFYHLLTMEDKQKAITRFRQLLKKNPDHLIYTISLAELLLQTKKIDAAVTLLEKSQQLNPQSLLSRKGFFTRSAFESH